ncbi:uncharacterized protein LTR77_008601 [Saxophila tyrrhenica]|uniref:Uncharacterized protein n=1 Tax=Saxophila tyrrhenica TaxID=1690608 RepID=A0AAV9P1V7_9PEZI|nr:hypothetical protein LTR77_008601 [Saxophila tyrrhenica]
MENNLDFLTAEGWSLLGGVIMSVFKTALSKLMSNEQDTSVEKQASVIAEASYQRAPMKSSDEQNEELMSLQQDACQTILAIAKQLPPRHLGQDLLTRTVAELEALCEEGSYVDVLGREVSDQWLDPTQEEADEDDDEEEALFYFTPTEWLNLNAFVARLVGAQISHWHNLTIWQLRTALEWPAPESNWRVQPRPFDTRVNVAAEWMIQAAPVLLRESLAQRDLDEQKRRSYGNGPLYNGGPGFAIERWVFWKRMLGDSKRRVGTDARERVDEALEKMTEAEKGIAEPRVLNGS